jgi:hypothetical protein
MSRRDIVVKTFVAAVVSLLLCGITAAELPELLTLTDNTSNDFTICKISSSRLSNAQSVQNVQKAAIDLNNPSHSSLFLHLGPFVKAELIPALLFILHSILRT